MKALRYLLIVLGLMSVLSISAQALAQKPEAQMQSTSVMVSSGSTLPQAAMTGAYVTGSTPGSYSPASALSKPRRVGEGDGFEDEDEPDKPGEPFPIGDAAWPLALLGMAFAGIRALRRRRA